MTQNLSRWIIVFVATSAILTGCGGAEQRFARAVETGRSFLAEGNYEKARVEFSNALQIDPNNAEVVYLSGTAAEKLGDYRAAFQAYQSALNIDANYIPARAAAGRLYVFGGMVDEALEYAEIGLGTAPGDPELLTLRAAANAARGERLLARTDAEAVVRSHPDQEQAVALLAGLYQSAGEIDAARTLLTRTFEHRPDSLELRIVSAELYYSIGDFDNAEAELKQGVALDEESPLPRQRLAQFYITVERDADAETVLRELIALSPEALEPKAALVNFKLTRYSFEAAEMELQRLIAEYPDERDLRLALGELYQANGRPEEAEEHLRGLIDEYRSNPAGLKASTRLAALLLESGREEEAVRFVDQVLTENPLDNDALILRSSIASAEGNALAAITDLRSVLRDQPENPAILAALARALAQNGDVALARDTYREAVGYDPGNARIRLEFADFLGRRGETREAEELLVALLASNPQDLAALETLFKVRMTSGDFEGAHTTAIQAVEYFPKHPLGFYLLGQYHELTGGSIEQAIAAYERSLENEPRGAESLGALVRVLARRGDRERARELVSRVVTDYPDHTVALNLLAELHLADGELDAATEWANRAIEVAPAWWVPYRTKALASAAEGDLAAARTAYTDGMAATDGAPGLGMELAVLLENINEADSAIAVYEQLVDANPASEILANNLAMLLSTYRTDSVSIDRAASLIQRFRNTDVPAFMNTYGWVRYRQGNFDEAVSYLERAVRASPEQSIMRYHFGMALIERGDVERAKSELAAAVATDQPFPGRDDALRALAELERPRG